MAGPFVMGLVRLFRKPASEVGIVMDSATPTIRFPRIKFNSYLVNMHVVTPVKEPGQRRIGAVSGGSITTHFSGCW